MKRRTLLGISLSAIILMTVFTGLVTSDALQMESTAKYNKPVPLNSNNQFFNVYMDCTVQKIDSSTQKKITENAARVTKELLKHPIIKGDANVAAQVTISVANEVSGSTSTSTPGENCFILLIAFYGALGMALTHPGSSYFWTMVAWKIADIAKVEGCWWAIGQENPAEIIDDSTVINMDKIVASEYECEGL